LSMIILLLFLRLNVCVERILSTKLMSEASCIFETV
jgi:hypothetical protein